MSAARNHEDVHNFIMSIPIQSDYSLYFLGQQGPSQSNQQVARQRASIGKRDVVITGQEIDGCAAWDCAGI